MAVLGRAAGPLREADVARFVGVLELVPAGGEPDREAFRCGEGFVPVFVEIFATCAAGERGAATGAAVAAAAEPVTAGVDSSVSSAATGTASAAASDVGCAAAPSAAASIGLKYPLLVSTLARADCCCDCTERAVDGPDCPPVVLGAKATCETRGTVAAGAGVAAAENAATDDVDGARLRLLRLCVGSSRADSDARDCGCEEEAASLTPLRADTLLCCDCGQAPSTRGTIERVICDCECTADI